MRTVPPLSSCVGWLAFSDVEPSDEVSVAGDIEDRDVAGRPGSGRPGRAVGHVRRLVQDDRTGRPAGHRLQRPGAERGCSHVCMCWCPRGDLNPHARYRALAPQASASAIPPPGRVRGRDYPTADRCRRTPGAVAGRVRPRRPRRGRDRPAWPRRAPRLPPSRAGGRHRRCVPRGPRPR